MTIRPPSYVFFGAQHQSFKNLPFLNRGKGLALGSGAETRGTHAFDRHEYAVSDGGISGLAQNFDTFYAFGA